MLVPLGDGMFVKMTPAVFAVTQSEFLYSVLAETAFFKIGETDVLPLFRIPKLLYKIISSIFDGYEYTLAFVL